MTTGIMGRVAIRPQGKAPFVVPLEEGAADAASEFAGGGFQQGTAHELVFEVETTVPSVLALGRYPVALRLFFGGQYLAGGTLTPKRTRTGFLLPPLTLAVNTFDEAVGSGSLRVELSNENGLTLVLSTAPIAIRFAAGSEGERQARMLEFLYENAGCVVASRKIPHRGGELNASAVDQTRDALLQRILLTASKLHRFFETSARFRLETHEKLVPLGRIDDITPKTLDFMTLHPEELVETAAETGIEWQNKYYAPMRALSEMRRPTRDLYENRCIASFLLTVLKTVEAGGEAVRGVIAQKRASSSIAAAGLPRELSAWIQSLRGLAASYAQLFGLTGVVPLTAAPRPTSVFVSSVPYRQMFELMKAWFDGSSKLLEEEALVLQAAKSSRLYEYYLLTRLVRVFGEEGVKKYCTIYPKFMELKRPVQLCNTFEFVCCGKEITVFFEPVVPSASLAQPNPVGLVRTMSVNFDMKGHPRNSVEQTFWTPDFVIRVTDSSGTRFWIADAKYTLWPTAMNEYAGEVLFKYLVATGTVNPNNRVAGFMLFCGKSLRNGVTTVNLRDLDSQCRSPALELMTVSVDDGLKADQAIRDWMKAL